jgi:hypothetical protein
LPEGAAVKAVESFGEMNIITVLDSTRWTLIYPEFSPFVERSTGEILRLGLGARATTPAMNIDCCDGIQPELPGLN